MVGLVAVVASLVVVMTSLVAVVARLVAVMASFATVMVGLVAVVASFATVTFGHVAVAASLVAVVTRFFSVEASFAAVLLGFVAVMASFATVMVGLVAVVARFATVTVGLVAVAAGGGGVSSGFAVSSALLASKGLCLVLVGTSFACELLCGFGSVGSSFLVLFGTVQGSFPGNLGFSEGFVKVAKVLVAECDEVIFLATAMFLGATSFSGFPQHGAPFLSTDFLGEGNNRRISVPPEPLSLASAGTNSTTVVAGGNVHVEMPVPHTASAALAPNQRNTAWKRGSRFEVATASTVPLVNRNGAAFAFSACLDSVDGSTTAPGGGTALFDENLSAAFLVGDEHATCVVVPALASEISDVGIPCKSARGGAASSAPARVASVENFNGGSVVIPGAMSAEGMNVKLAGIECCSPALEPPMLVQDGFAALWDFDGRGLVVHVSATAKSSHEATEVARTNAEGAPFPVEPAMLIHGNFASATA